MDAFEVVERAAQWAGLTLPSLARVRLERYRDWLYREAMPAGGLGPSEGERLEVRHLADSLCFAGAWRSSPPSRLVDVGSGVGLPGIPLAITHPDTVVTLVDRSGRRCRLARRAVRVLGLDNATVVQADVADIDDRWPVVVARALLGPDRIDRLLGLVEPGGMVVIGGSHRRRPVAPGFDVIEIPAEILDSTAWLLTMARP